jgi:hypothetical protein
MVQCENKTMRSRPQLWLCSVQETLHRTQPHLVGFSRSLSSQHINESVHARHSTPLMAHPPFHPRACPTHARSRWWPCQLQAQACLHALTCPVRPPQCALHHGLAREQLIGLQHSQLWHHALCTPFGAAFGTPGFGAAFGTPATPAPPLATDTMLVDTLLPPYTVHVLSHSCNTHKTLAVWTRWGASEVPHSMCWLCCARLRSAGASRCMIACTTCTQTAIVRITRT